MSLTDLLKMCAQNLRRRKGRTFLSVLGVVVGCCSSTLPDCATRRRLPALCLSICATLYPDRLNRKRR